MCLLDSSCEKGPSLSVCPTSPCPTYQTLTSVPHSWLKWRKFRHSIHERSGEVIHKRLGEVVAMNCQEREGTILSIVGEFLLCLPLVYVLLVCLFPVSVFPASVFA